jgi:hypothetical protein
MKINIMDGRGVNDSELYLETCNINNNVEKPTSEPYADDLTIIFKMNNNNVGVILEML